MFGMRGARGRLALRFAVLLTAVLLVTVGVYSAWSSVEQRQASEQKVLEEARLLSQQMSASWDYVDSVQNTINYDAGGRYHFKGIYCSVAGKSIAQRFTRMTDCIIRYTRENPRTGSDAPDAFESEALQAFKAGAQEHYGVVEYEGEQVFRYTSAIHIEYGCLMCHGDPAGETDETGYPKEGMAIGDLAGAVSLIIPMEQFRQEAATRATSNVVLFVALAVFIVALTSLALHHWVTRPLSKLATAAQEVGSGRFDATMDEVKATGEIAELAREFSQMERNLKDFYGELEHQVQSRTAQLTEANAALEGQRDKIASMNEQLVEANDRLVQENEYKSTFLAMMSHELRTPVASIIAVAQMLSKTAANGNPEAIELANEIKRSGNALLTTINNSLDAASIEAQRFTVRVAPTDLLDVVNAVEAAVAPLAREGGLHLEVRVDEAVPLVVTDPDVLHKILMNLLGNAVKFTAPGGRVEATVELDEACREIVLVVSDTGIGIPEADLALIFERFKQADSSVSRKYGGSGLGLSLVKDMAELMGGSVHVSSVEGQGSVFTVRVPYQDIEEL